MTTKRRKPKQPIPKSQTVSIPDRKYQPSKAELE